MTDAELRYSPRLSTDSRAQGLYVEGNADSSPILSQRETDDFLQPYTTVIPTVVVSSPTDSDLSGSATCAGRVPITALVTSNFSRPRRPIVIKTPESEEQKRRVLQRNRWPQSHDEMGTSPSKSVTNNVTQLRAEPRSRSVSPLRSGSTTPGAGPSSHNIATHRSPLPLPQLQTTKPDAQDSAFRRPVSPASSLYSTNYSFYEYDSATPSPIGPLSPSSSDPRLDPADKFSDPSQAAYTVRPQALSHIGNIPSTSMQRTSQEYLQLGIQHHETNQLKESAACFEKSATQDGGCGVGMLMWGLTLRHGWGCEKNERLGFKWLRRAAESAVADLENARKGGSLDVSAVKSELVLAIYEVGQCFFQGWGVPKDQKMAVSYYQVAARLGDPDAQTDLGFCFANGRGCKKDRKEAAKWYRAAVAQGQSDVGLAWIYKDKFQ